MNDDIGEHAGAVHRRDAAQMFRWLFIAGIIAAVVVVAMDNRKDARVGYVFDEALAPTWTVIVASVVVGVVIGWLVRHLPRRRV